MNLAGIEAVNPSVSVMPRRTPRWVAATELPADAEALRAGEILHDRYRIERALGAGGMATIYLARHLQLGTQVAIKVLAAELSADEEAVARFAGEAAAAARIGSDHVVRIFDVGKLASGTPYIVMEYLEGQDCAAYLAQHGPLPIEEAIAFVVQACVGVAEAHALGIVHRDLKPSNLFCVRRPDGRPLVKVLDFGVSRMSLVDEATPGTSASQPEIMLGSPLYVSPEQWRNVEDLDARADIWALGVILYELLAGTVPFEGSSLGEIAIRVVGKPPASLRELRPDVSPELERVVLKCLAKERSDRFRDVAELVSALAAFVPGQTHRLLEPQTEAPAPVLPATVTSDQRAETDLLPARNRLASVISWVGRSRRKPRRERAFAFGAGLAVALLLGLSITNTLHSRVRRDGPAPGAVPGFSAARLPTQTTSGETPTNAEAPPRTTVASSAATPSSRPSAGSGTPLRGPGAGAGRVASRRLAPRPVLRRSADSCSPPTYVDARGNRVFKVECL